MRWRLRRNPRTLLRGRRDLSDSRCVRSGDIQRQWSIYQRLRWCLQLYAGALLPRCHNNVGWHRVPRALLLRRRRRATRHLRHRRLLVPRFESFRYHLRVFRGPLRDFRRRVDVHRQHVRRLLCSGFLLPVRLNDEPRRHGVRSHDMPRRHVQHRRVCIVLLHRDLRLHPRPLLRSRRDISSACDLRRGDLQRPRRLD